MSIRVSNTSCGSRETISTPGGTSTVTATGTVPRLVTGRINKHLLLGQLQLFQHASGTGHDNIDRGRIEAGGQVRIAHAQRDLLEGTREYHVLHVDPDANLLQIVGQQTVLGPDEIKIERRRLGQPTQLQGFGQHKLQTGDSRRRTGDLDGVGHQLHLADLVVRGRLVVHVEMDRQGACLDPGNIEVDLRRADPHQLHPARQAERSDPIRKDDRPGRIPARSSTTFCWSSKPNRVRGPRTCTSTESTWAPVTTRWGGRLRHSSGKVNDFSVSRSPALTISHSPAAKTTENPFMKRFRKRNRQTICKPCLSMDKKLLERGTQRADIQVALDPPFPRQGYHPFLFRYHDNERVGLLGQPDCRPVTRAKVFIYPGIGGQRQETPGCAYSPGLDDNRAVMNR